MKHRIIILALMALTAVSGAQNVVDKQGRKQGHWIKTDNQGAKIFEGNFKNGLEVDTFTYFYPSGTVRIRNTYTTPGKICKHEAYDEKGHMIATGRYNQKNRDGEWRLFNEEGKLVKIANYKMGVRDGLQVIFNSNGDTAEVSNWTDNHRNGRWWKRIGEKGWITGNYVKGGLEGLVMEYDQDGTKMREGQYKDGLKHGAYKFFEKGKLTVDESWNHGVLLDRKVLLSGSKDKYVSIFGIAYIYPKGTNKSVVMMMDGTSMACNESVDVIEARTGSDLFVIIDKKSRVSSNKSCIQGLAKDDEGRTILSLDPKPAFTIYPDEECQKTVLSLQRLDQLDEKE